MLIISNFNKSNNSFKLTTLTNISKKNNKNLSNSGDK